VAMAMLEHFPDRMAGLILMHSTPFPDDETKKTNRDRAIKLIEKGMKRQLVMGHAPSTFALKNVEQFTLQLDLIKDIGMNTPDRGIISALKGMKNRPDRSQVLREANIPVQLVYGLQDGFIPVEASLRIAGLMKDPSVLKLSNSGHMGFIEEKDLVLEGNLRFIKQCFQSIQ
jgi:pimeloyl-ACP methyl ester carboxylesterase